MILYLDKDNDEGLEAGWYFVNEIGCLEGPYPSEMDARKALFAYVALL